jgi:large subunit ribosomal protein L10
MKKEDKYIVVEQITQLVNEYEHFYVTDIAALNSEETSSLRRACHKEDVKLYVVKNTLLKKALQGLETDYSSLFDTLKGNTALMFCNTGNAAANFVLI